MNRKYQILTVGLLVVSAAHALTVDRVSKSQMSLLLKVESGEKVSIGDKVCAQLASGGQVCGTITRYRGSQPVADLERSAEGIKRGDLVKIELSIEESKRSPIRLGLRVGLVEAGMSAKGIDLATFSRSGLGAGAMLEVPLNESLRFQTELGFADYGYQIQSVKLKVTHSCIEAQALLKYKLGPVFPLIGLAPAYAISTKAYLDDALFSQNASQILKPFMLSAVFGLGTYGQVGSNYSLGFDLRYLLGLSNISPTGEGTVKNSAFFLGITFWF